MVKCCPTELLKTESSSYFDQRVKTLPGNLGHPSAVNKEDSLTMFHPENKRPCPPDAAQASVPHDGGTAATPWRGL